VLETTFGFASDVAAAESAAGAGRSKPGEGREQPAHTARATTKNKPRQLIDPGAEAASARAEPGAGR